MQWGQAAGGGPPCRVDSCAPLFHSRPTLLPPSPARCSLVLGVRALKVEFQVAALLVVRHRARERRQLLHAQRCRVHAQQRLLWLLLVHHPRGGRGGGGRGSCQAAAPHSAPPVVVVGAAPTTLDPTLISAKGLRMPESSMQMLCARRCSTSRTSSGREAPLRRSIALFSITWGRVGVVVGCWGPCRATACGCDQRRDLEPAHTPIHTWNTPPPTRTPTHTHLEQRLQLVEIEVQAPLCGARPHCAVPRLRARSGGAQGSAGGGARRAAHANTPAHAPLPPRKRTRTCRSFSQCSCFRRRRCTSLGPPPG